MSSISTFTPPVPGRTVDLLAFHTATPFQTTRTEMKLVTAGGGKATTGLQKMAQLIAIRLYTGTNGKLYDADEGHAFGDLLRSGQIRTLEDVRRSFLSAAKTIRDQFYLDKLRYPDTPSDEVPEQIKLTDASISGDTLSLTISIISVAGESAQFIFPVVVS